MLGQRWFWIALVALLLTNFELMKIAFCIGLGIDFLAWVVGLLQMLNERLKQRRYLVRLEQEHVRGALQQQRRKEEDRQIALEIERERTLQQVALIEAEHRREQDAAYAKRNRIPIATERCKTLKSHIDALDLDDTDKKTLKGIVDKQLFLLLKGELHEL